MPKSAEMPLDKKLVASTTDDQTPQAIQSSIPRVRSLSQPTHITNQTTLAATKNEQNKSDWNCQANSNGTWDCKQTTHSPQQTVALSSDALIEETKNSTDDNTLFPQIISQLTENPWGTCQIKATNKQQQTQELRANANTSIQANYVKSINNNNAHFSGDVAIKRADQTLIANQVDYDTTLGHAHASGDVFYQERGFAIYSQQAQIQLNDDTGQFTNNHFILEDNHSRGTTQSTQLIDKNVSQSKQVAYTTCEPNKTAWELQAKQLELNKQTGRGTALNVWVEFFDIPFFYTPYLSFPIDDRRQSGFLTPTVGYSDTTGADLSTPYYWNIAPNYDATLTPRLMSDRGLMLGAELRYLSEKSEGQLSTEILNDSKTDDLRGQFSYQNKTLFSSNLNSSIDLNYVSDDDYLDDFGNNLTSSSRYYMKSEARLNYFGSNWNLLSKIDNYDPIDESITSTSKPYRRLPQILFNLYDAPIFSVAKVGMRNEFVYFDHSAKTTAGRLDLQPAISIPLRSPGSFITPKLGLRHTEYHLSNQAIPGTSHINRTLPILSLDSGLIFERNSSTSTGIRQTLEPRAFYLYIPHKNQDNIPLFDTSEYDFSFNQLFRENRFSGADRVADANQLSLAITSRFIENSSGKERLRASLGSIIYFEDSDVTLTPTSPSVTNNSSDIVAELSATINDYWSARSALQYDPHNSKTQKATLGLHYRNGDNKLFNASYRSRHETLTTDIEQTDLSFKWPLSKTWSSVGRWNYSLENNLTLESFFGIEKDNCCWRFRIIARRYVNDASDEEPTQGLFFQLELKGLTSLGEKLDSFLEEGILGYQPPKY